MAKIFDESQAQIDRRENPENSNSGNGLAGFLRFISSLIGILLIGVGFTYIIQPGDVFNKILGIGMILQGMFSVAIGSGIALIIEKLQNNEVKK